MDETDEGTPPSSCWLTYAGQLRRIDADDDDFQFGRGAGNDLDVERETDTLLHRRFGRIYFDHGVWWIANDGSHLSLAVNDRTTTSSIVLAPGASAALSFSEAEIRFSARRPDYEILVEMDRDSSRAPSTVGDHSQSSKTKILSDLPLAGSHRLLLVALAESKLISPHQPLELPSNKAVARRFGWNRKQFDGRLARLCQRLAKQGAEDLLTDPGGLPATNRRRKAVTFALMHQIVTPDDLELLTEYPE